MIHHLLDFTLCAGRKCNCLAVCYFITVTVDLYQIATADFVCIPVRTCQSIVVILCVGHTIAVCILVITGSTRFCGYLIVIGVLLDRGSVHRTVIRRI